MLRLKCDFSKILELGERYLWRIVIIGVLLIIIVQALTSYDYMTYGWNLTDNPGNIENKEVQGTTAEGTITLELETYNSLHNAAVLINGNPVAYFENNRVTIGVNPGDEVYIDTSYYNSPITVKIVNIHGDIILNETQGTVECSTMGLTRVGRVIKKNQKGMN